MKPINAFNTKDFLRKFLQIQSINYNFNPREIAIAVEFLYWRSVYLKTPLKPEPEEDEEGNPVEPFEDLITQLKDKRTLNKITHQLDMSFTVLRKHVQGLKEKGFFKGGDIDDDFITDGIVVHFTLNKKRNA
jgi:hypothetical protein